MELEVFQVDSFTTELFRGNPAGVVLNAEGLSVAQMLGIARELNNSETAFVFKVPGPGYDLEVRFFTPRQEVPICGHATIAAHYVYARSRGIREGTIVQKTGAGILPVEIHPVQDSPGGPEDLRVVMTQGAIEYGRLIEGEARADLVRGLGIDELDLDPSLPIQIVSTGHSKVLVPIASRYVLDRISIRPELLSSLSARIGCNGYYAFTFDSGEASSLVSGRMFAPAIGIAEDPVTGNANGPLGAWLAHLGRLDIHEGGRSFVAKQGEAIGRTGHITVEVFGTGREPRLVKIGGRARLVFRTTITI